MTSAIAVTADRQARGTPFHHFWSTCVGAGLYADRREHLRQVTGAAGFRYARFHCLLHDDMVVSHRLADGTPVHDYRRLDDLLDHLRDIGVRPFLELSCGAGDPPGE